MTNRKRGQLDELCMDRYTDAHLLPVLMIWMTWKSD